MSNTSPRGESNWVSRLLIVILLFLAGGAAAVWALTRWPEAGRYVGIATVPSQPVRQQALPKIAEAVAMPRLTSNNDDARIAALEARIANVENATRQAAGSAGRADALLIAFAARRSLDRGVPLGYLENLLTNRFGSTNPQAVATIITASRNPVRLDQLEDGFDQLEPVLMSPEAGSGWWDDIRHSVGSIVTIHTADQPSPQPAARYERARTKLGLGQVDGALAETMRLPGASRAGPWIDQARRYIAANRALDEIESAALLGSEHR